MVTYNDLVNHLSEITYLASGYLSYSSRSHAENLNRKINEISVLLDKLWEKETEEANERQEQDN